MCGCGCVAQGPKEQPPTKSVSLSFDDWLERAEEVELDIKAGNNVTDLYYMKMVGTGGQGNDVRQSQPALAL